MIPSATWAERRRKKISPGSEQVAEDLFLRPGDPQHQTSLKPAEEKILCHPATYAPMARVAFCSCETAGKRMSSSR